MRGCAANPLPSGNKKSSYLKENVVATRSDGIAPSVVLGKDGIKEYSGSEIIYAWKRTRLA